ncbi:MAG TPA: type II secretion system protein GspM [Alphaproteobacteria bacterium]|nr:type II secretion system protein GspM [Alphaproteobacteria bacterium]
MQIALSKPVSRFAAIGLLLLALLLVHALIVRPLAKSWRDTVTAIEDARLLAAGYARAAAARSQYEEQAQTLRAEQPNPDWFLEGQTDALAAAALQDRIGSMVQSAGAELRSIQAVSAVDEEGMWRVGISVELATKTAALLRLAYAIESGTPYLFINTAETIADPSQGGIEDPTLIVRLEISGYRQPDQS